MGRVLPGSDDPVGLPVLRRLPNLISAARLGTAPILLALALADRQQTFAWLLMAAVTSDAIDGHLARRLGVVSRLGTLLDSAADAFLLFATVVGIVAFFPEEVARHGVIIGLTLGLILLHYALSLARYGRLASFHTYLARIMAVVFAVFLIVLFLWGFVDWLFYLTITLCLLDLAEEFVLLWLLPTWTPNVGSLWHVLRRRQGRRVDGEAP